MEIVDLIVGRLHETIRNGEIGLDYTFDCNREKNKSFDREYNLSISKKEEILLKLEREHYVKSEESMNKAEILGNRVVSHNIPTSTSSLIQRLDSSEYPPNSIPRESA